MLAHEVEHVLVLLDQNASESRCPGNWVIAVRIKRRRCAYKLDKAYRLPTLRSATRKVVAMAKMNVSIPDELKQQMDQWPDVNWSRVAQEAFSTVVEINQLKG